MGEFLIKILPKFVSFVAFFNFSLPSSSLIQSEKVLLNISIFLLFFLIRNFSANPPADTGPVSAGIRRSEHLLRAGVLVPTSGLESRVDPLTAVLTPTPSASSVRPSDRSQVPSNKFARLVKKQLFLSYHL